jgi:hypothetical protein
MQRGRVVEYGDDLGLAGWDGDIDVEIVRDKRVRGRGRAFERPERIGSMFGARLVVKPRFAVVTDACICTANRHSEPATTHLTT